MARIDIIEAAVKAYDQVWRERAYLWKLAMVPILIKIVCEVTVLSLGWETEYIKQSLILLPSYLAEGWMIAHFVRLIFLDHRWPYRPSGDFDKDIVVLRERARGVTGGMVVYTLIKMALIGFVALSYGSIENMDEAAKSGEAANEPASIMFLLSVLLMLFFMWAFRFLWIFVPVALNYSVRDYVRKLHGFMSSVWLIGVWLVCFFPPFFLSGLFASLVFSGIEHAGTTTVFFFSIFRVLVDVVVTLITTAGICRVLGDIIGGADKNMPTPRA